MKRLNNSNFELLEDIIKTLEFNYSEENSEILEKIKEFWKEVVGDKISKFSAVHEISKDSTLIVYCSDSIVANELYYEKDKLIKFLGKKTEEMGITIKDIRFEYKKWKDNQYEKEI